VVGGGAFMRTGIRLSVVLVLVSIATIGGPETRVFAAAPSVEASTATANTDAGIKEGYSPQQGDSLVSSIVGAHVYSSTAV
jgi:hypothetical protein